VLLLRWVEKRELLSSMALLLLMVVASLQSETK